jgi:hypothetical protein
MRSCRFKNVAAPEEHKILFLSVSFHFLASLQSNG